LGESADGEDKGWTNKGRHHIDTGRKRCGPKKMTPTAIEGNTEKSRRLYQPKPVPRIGSVWER